jgi:folylpolyglutamate synthase/dihydropteroate synthase
MKQLMQEQQARLQAVENDAEHLFDLAHSVPDAQTLAEKLAKLEPAEKL